VLPITIYPRDPLVARDGRPYGRGASNRMYCLPWPYPSVVAGSLRTMLGKEIAGCRDAFGDLTFVDRLKRIGVRGPIPLYDDQLYFPRPRNFLRAPGTQSKSFEIEKLEPSAPKRGWGMNLPELWPLLSTIRTKPDLGEALWHKDLLYSWLLSSDPFNYDVKSTMPYPVMEERTHVALDGERRVAIEGALFSTQGIGFIWGKEQGLSLRVTFPDSEWHEAVQGKALVHPVGGVRRLATWHMNGEDDDQWQAPGELAARLTGARHISMYVATPAVFAGGWRPGWLDAETLSGKIPGTDVRVLLRGAAVGRWQPVSGWCYEQGGPKPIRRLVPAGSIYFFDVLEGDPIQLSDHWLRPFSDDDRDAQDGFGLVCWGIWSGGTSE
jgi:CRISPR-associated protein Cmr3